MEWYMLYPKNHPPTMEQAGTFIQSSLWQKCNSQIPELYQARLYIEHSCCSMQPGWNFKYKKSGKTLCTLYPMPGYFIALVVIGNREMTETELMMPTCTQYVQSVFKDTLTGNGQKWLMLEVKNNVVLEDVYSLMELKIKAPK